MNRWWFAFQGVFVVILILLAALVVARAGGIPYFDVFVVDNFFPGGLLLLFVIPWLLLLVARQVAARQTNRRVAAQGWAVLDDPAGREWPWTGLRRQGTIEVGKAWTFQAGGFPVIAGDIVWTGNAFSGATEEPDDAGIFVVIRLPAPAPSMGLRRPYRIVGDVPPEVVSLVWPAFESGRIPTFTVTGHHLFTIETHAEWFDPARIDECVRRALLVAELLELTPAAPVVPADGTD